MSLLFRTRTPRKLRRKSAATAPRATPVPVFDPRVAALAPVRHAPRRRSHRNAGYATHRPRQPMFRVT